jgi:2-keto-3-deoxy-L-fuconate dehydrogenase
MSGELSGKRVLITQVTDYMGPPIAALFAEQGADVVASSDDLTAPPGAARAIVAQAGRVDVLVANLAHPPLGATADQIADEDWAALFDGLVHPLMRLVRAVLPQMLDRGAGKIVAVTSAAPLRGIPKASAYCAARGAQNAFIRAVGLEVAPRGVQVNAIGQNYVKNDTYYPPGLVESDRFQKHLARNVPIGRIGEPRETAELALFLASDRSNFIVGQVIPFAGGWTTSSG